MLSQRLQIEVVEAGATVEAVELLCDVIGAAGGEGGAEVCDQIVGAL